MTNRKILFIIFKKKTRHLSIFLFVQKIQLTKKNSKQAPSSKFFKHFRGKRAEEDLLEQTSSNKEEKKTTKHKVKNKQLNSIKEKLKRYWFHYLMILDIRLTLLTQQKGEKGKWPNSLDYSLIYENIELPDIWKICHISIRGEVGNGKSVLSQRIAYLWGNYQIWNHQFHPFEKNYQCFSSWINTNLKSWLQHCIFKSKLFHNYHKSIQYNLLNVIKFQLQDIQNYIKNSNESDLLIKKLNNNQSLKLLSHIPLYLRLFCYLSRKDKSNDDKWNEMILLKLYETLLKSYMKWIE
ncbi:hypothetical protein RFI_05400 [Reticulomyxa filosa]|uniref:Uncharacterized protein n=1 Tax=Reticulomyxa filosa TaxID=46433 RepID=X6P0G2_RETFI|nr:hypothetical protein RFI_05400 [Reticulomyxa filosa]|eukprot:ETO31721.1 hypothetical protein RFI_05400 [Reticulomyxa filosa]